MIDDAELADYLRGEGLLSDREIEQARVIGDREDRSLYEVVIDHDFVDEAPVVNFASELLNVAAVDPLAVEPDPDIIELVPRPVVDDHDALPLMHEETGEGKRLVLAMRDPIDMIAMDEIAIYSEVDIRPVLAGPKSLHAAIERFYDENDGSDFASDVALPDDASEASDTGKSGASAARKSGEVSAESNPNSTHVGPITSSIDPDEGASDYELSDSDDLTFEAEASGSFEPDSPLVGSDDPIASGDEPDPDLDESSVQEEEEEEEEGEAIGRIAVKQIAVPKSEADQYESGQPIVAEGGPRQESEVDQEEASAAETVESHGEVEAAVAQIDADNQPEEPEDRLSALRRRLGRDSSSSNADTNDDPSSFLDRLEVAADGVDEDTRRRLRSLDRTQLLEGAVVALVEKGLLSATDILEAIDE